MKIRVHDTIYGVLEEGILSVSDFLLPFVILENDSDRDVCVQSLSFAVYAGSSPVQETVLCAGTLAIRAKMAEAEWAYYRTPAWQRILGMTCEEDFLTHKEAADRLTAVGLSLQPGEKLRLHQQFFRIPFQSGITACQLLLKTREGIFSETVKIILNPSRNVWQFPIHRDCLISGCYRDPDAHRWCYNSEFAMDVGALNEEGYCTPECILGEPVHAMADGTVLAVMNEIPTDTLSGEELETLYGNDARIDGNYMILQHAHGECSLYAHMLKNDLGFQVGDRVTAGQVIGYVGSTGNSTCPHLHFHVFLKKEEGFGPSIPICFEDICDIYGDPLETVPGFEMAIKQKR